MLVWCVLIGFLKWMFLLFSLIEFLLGIVVLDRYLIRDDLLVLLLLMMVRILFLWSLKLVLLSVVICLYCLVRLWVFIIS